MKRIFLATIIFLFVFGWSAAPAKADSPLQNFYAVKTCSTFFTTWTCTIVDGSLASLDGAVIHYSLHRLATNDGGVTHQASTIMIHQGNDMTSGHVSWSIINGEFIGTVTIEPGTGIFEGFHAVAEIAPIAPTGDCTAACYSFTGTYFYTP